MSVGSTGATGRLSRAVTPTSTFSAAGWFYLAAGGLGVTSFPVLIHMTRANGDGLFLLCDGNNTAFYGGNQGLATTSSGISTAVEGEWVYGGISVNGANVTVYISRQNGASEVASFTVASSNVLTVELEQEDSGTYRSGSFVDHMRTWNVALTQAEFDAERNSATAVKTSGLVSDSLLPDTSTLDSWSITGTLGNGADSPYIAGPPTFDIDLLPSVAGYVGATATMAVAVSSHLGTGLAYQWEVDTGSGWSNIGTDSPSYTTPTLAPGMTGYLYRVTATDSVGSATSTAATLSAILTWPDLAALGELAFGEIEVINVSAAAAITEAADTVSATGTISGGGGGGVDATLNVTEAADTASGTATIPVSATAGITEAADTVSGSAVVVVGASLSVTESADTVSGSAPVMLAAALAVTEAQDTAAGTGAVVVGATATITEAPDTAAGAAGVLVSGSASITEAPDTLAATADIGTTSVTATADITEAPDTASGAATVAVVASATINEAPDTISATLAALVAGVASITEAPDTLSASGIVLASSFTINAARARLIYNLALLHGLVPGSPLVVSANARSAGATIQTVTQAGDTTTISTTSMDGFAGDLDEWIDALAAVHGLTADLVVTPTARTSGSLNQAMDSTAGVVTVTTP